jgi:hypothetical protein
LARQDSFEDNVSVSLRISGFCYWSSRLIRTNFTALAGRWFLAIGLESWFAVGDSPESVLFPFSDLAFANLELCVVYLFIGGEASDMAKD